MNDAEKTRRALAEHHIKKRRKREIAERNGSICSTKHGHGCGKEFPLDDLTIDHIIPLAIGGAKLDPDNMQLLCKECHKQKTKKDNVGVLYDTNYLMVQRASRKPIMKALRRISSKGLLYML